MSIVHKKFIEIEIISPGGETIDFIVLPDSCRDEGCSMNRQTPPAQIPAEGMLMAETHGI